MTCTLMYITTCNLSLQHMWDQEKVHRDTMNKLITEHRVRPTVLLPFWRTAGFVLGASTALLGKCVLFKSMFTPVFSVY